MAVQQPAHGGSPLREWCIGVVAENKLPSTNTIKVIPLEMTPLMQGEATSNPEDHETEIFNAQGVAIKSTLRTDTVTSAEWWPEDDRMLDAPAVRRLTKVQLYRYADSKRIFWRDLGLDRELKRGERYRIGVTATTQEDRGANGIEDDHYVLDINGPMGMVMLSTSEANGEKAGYTFSIDAKNGRAFFGDNVGNHYRLDTVNHILEITNCDGTRQEINLRNMLLEGQETITTKFKDLLDVIGETVKQTAGKTISQEAGESITLKAPKIFLDGQIYMQGPITQQQGSYGYGVKCSFIGDAEWTGNMEAKGTWKVNGVDVSEHDHDETGSRTKKPNPS